jgi:hypothetical protein
VHPNMGQVSRGKTALAAYLRNEAMDKDRSAEGKSSGDYSSGSSDAEVTQAQRKSRR